MKNICTRHFCAFVWIAAADAETELELPTTSITSIWTAFWNSMVDIGSCPEKKTERSNFQCNPLKRKSSICMQLSPQKPKPKPTNKTAHAVFLERTLVRCGNFSVPPRSVHNSNPHLAIGLVWRTYSLLYNSIFFLQLWDFAVHVWVRKKGRTALKKEFQMLYFYCRTHRFPRCLALRVQCIKMIDWLHFKNRSTVLILGLTIIIKIWQNFKQLWSCTLLWM